ncbi:hypothetical protein ACFWY9_28365 [Amycolatopsis sp. NPDC059027]|uniref:hypothetical protein n=1 Tax=unclassified Amycolatopsis TaxID=2618356 RepID=UPI003671C9A6
MFVHVGGDGAVRVEEGDDCTRLHVATELDSAATGQALRDAGFGGPADEPDSAWLSVESLRENASRGSVGADWPGRWDAMIAYAARKGWLTADGTKVAAHIEHPAPA